jgi:hypothetical protein
LDGNGIQDGEIAGEDQDPHQDEEESSSDVDDLDVALKLAEKMEEGVDGNRAQ